MRRADGCEAWSSEPPGLVPPHRGQALASAGEAAVKDAEGAAQRGVGEPKCAAFWGDRASLTGASSWLVRWENRDEASLSGGAPVPPLRLIDHCPARCATARTSRPDRKRTRLHSSH